MPIDKAQRYDAAVAGLRDMIARAKADTNDLIFERNSLTTRIDEVRKARNGLENLLDDLLREPPKPAHIEDDVPPPCKMCSIGTRQACVLEGCPNGTS